MTIITTEVVQTAPDTYTIFNVTNNRRDVDGRIGELLRMVVVEDYTSFEDFRMCTNIPDGEHLAYTPVTHAYDWMKKLAETIVDSNKFENRTVVQITPEETIVEVINRNESVETSVLYSAPINVLLLAVLGERSSIKIKDTNINEPYVELIGHQNYIECILLRNKSKAFAIGIDSHNGCINDLRNNTLEKEILSSIVRDERVSKLNNMDLLLGFEKAYGHGVSSNIINMTNLGPRVERMICERTYSKDGKIIIFYKYAGIGSTEIFKTGDCDIEFIEFLTEFAILNKQR